MHENQQHIPQYVVIDVYKRQIYVNIDFLEPNSHISAADLDRACGDRIQEGDVYKRQSWCTSRTIWITRRTSFPAGRSSASALRA